MRYFYADADNQAAGPVTERELVTLRQQGIIDDDTMVFLEGGQAWQPYRTLQGAAGGARTDEPVPVQEPLPRVHPVPTDRAAGDSGLAADLATPGERLLAQAYNGMVLLLPILLWLLIEVTLAGSDPISEERLGLGLLFGMVWIAGVMIYQFYLLTKFGQDIGKRIKGIRIVKRSDGANGGFISNVVLRYVVNSLIGFIVPFYGIIDILFIFGPEHRCLHDYIAGTIVVRGHPEPEGQEGGVGFNRF